MRHDAPRTKRIARRDFMIVLSDAASSGHAFSLESSSEVEFLCHEMSPCVASIAAAVAARRTFTRRMLAWKRTWKGLGGHRKHPSDLLGGNDSGCRWCFCGRCFRGRPAGGPVSQSSSHGGNLNPKHQKSQHPESRNETKNAASRDILDHLTSFASNWAAVVAQRED